MYPFGVWWELFLKTFEITKTCFCFWQKILLDYYYYLWISKLKGISFCYFIKFSLLHTFLYLPSLSLVIISIIFTPIYAEVCQVTLWNCCFDTLLLLLLFCFLFSFLFFTFYGILFWHLSCENIARFYAMILYCHITSSTSL